MLHFKQKKKKKLWNFFSIWGQRISSSTSDRIEESWFNSHNKWIPFIARNDLSIQLIHVKWIKWHLITTNNSSHQSECIYCALAVCWTLSRFKALCGWMQTLVQLAFNFVVCSGESNRTVKTELIGFKRIWSQLMAIINAKASNKVINHIRFHQRNACYCATGGWCC